MEGCCPPIPLHIKRRAELELWPQESLCQSLHGGRLPTCLTRSSQWLPVRNAGRPMQDASTPRAQPAQSA